MADREAKDALVRRIRRHGQSARERASGRVDRRARAGRTPRRRARVEIGQSVANTSFHLRVLAGAGLVTTRRDGTRIHYRLASGRVGELWTALRDVAAAHHAHLDELAAAYLGDRTNSSR
jgi:DNA-binding transcriptional ArsR family regulator